MANSGRKKGTTAADHPSYKNAGKKSYRKAPTRYLHKILETDHGFKLVDEILKRLRELYEKRTNTQEPLSFDEWMKCMQEEMKGLSNFLQYSFPKMQGLKIESESGETINFNLSFDPSKQGVQKKKNND
jgi:hypothetical protein